MFCSMPAQCYYPISLFRFDYQGCGESPGDLRDMTLTDWREDCLAVLDQVTAGPQILVGSSLGGLLMLYTALKRPHRVNALVGIATAADFPRRGFQNYPQEVRDYVCCYIHVRESMYVALRKDMY